MGRLVLVLLGVLTVAAFASSRAADPPSLKGTWVRETMVGPTMGNQVILTFTDHRVTARLRSGGRDPGGQEGWITFEFEGEYARTDSGLLVGTITGMNVDLSKIPDGDSPGELLGKSVSKMIGEPFCFRARVSDGALTVTDLKVPDVKIDDEHSSREMIAGFASGKYVSSPMENVPVPKLKAAKTSVQNHSKLVGDILGIVWNTCTPRSLPAAKNDLPSPKYLDHYPEYFQPDPVFPPQVMVPSPVPSSGNSTSAMPAMLAPQPVPSVMPASVTSVPQPIAQCLSSELVPGSFFYFRPCHVTESFFIRMDETKLPITLPVTPAFVPQHIRSIYMLGGAGKIFASKFIVSIPCWQGVENTPIPHMIEITPCSPQFQETFMPQLQKDHLLGGRGVEPDARIRTEELMRQAETFRPIEGTWRRFWFNDMPQKLEEVVPAMGTGAVDNKKPAVIGANPFTNDVVGRFPSRSDTTRMENNIMDSGNPCETVIREIDLGEAGKMQVIVRLKGGNAKQMMPPPTPTMAPMLFCPPETVCPTPSLVSQLPMQPPVPSTLIPTAGQMLPPGSMRNVPVMPAIADAWKNATRIEGGIMK